MAQRDAPILSSVSRASYNVLGLDAGYSVGRRTSGVLLAEVRDRVLRAVRGPFNVMELEARSLARSFCLEFVVAAVAIDAPLAKTHQFDYRPVESVFSLGRFQNHCKPGNTAAQVGQRLHHAGMNLAGELNGVATYCGFAELSRPVGTPIVEVFPSAALGVLTTASELKACGTTRSKKSDVLFEALWKLKGAQIGCIRLHSSLEVSNHDQRMAVVAAALAACFVEGQYTAVGEELSGYFMMPRLDSWNPQWQAELRLTLPRVVNARVFETALETAN
jgi:predicted nuclease with RNAse H fold